jgi:hypothetical protein
MRISDEAKKFNIEIVPATPNAAGQVYRARDVWTTRDGKWDVDGAPGGIVQWARDTYLKAWGSPDYFDDAGGDHHMFGGIYNEPARSMENNAVVHYWTWTDDSNHVDMPVKVKSGWANVEMFNKFDPASPTKPQGAWAWKLKTDIPCDVIKGGGLPGGWHVSYFASWILTNESGVPPVDPPPTGDLDARVAKLEAWARAISAKYPQGPQYNA